MKSIPRPAIEERTARLTILVDPRKKGVFERLCAEDDVTPSQMVRRWIRAYIEERLGRPWNPEDPTLVSAQAREAPTAKRTSKQR